MPLWNGLTVSLGHILEYLLREHQIEMIIFTLRAEPSAGPIAMRILDPAETV